MLHRITSVWVLCIGLLIAGVPAPVCCAASAPAHDCCAPAQPMPGPQHLSFALEPAALMHVCCAAGGAETGAISARATRHDIGKHPHRADPPTLAAAYGSLIVASEPPAAKTGFAVPNYLPLLSSLYLRTGRLRL